MAFADNSARSLNKNACAISTPVTRCPSQKYNYQNQGEQLQAVRGAIGTGTAQSILCILTEAHRSSLRPLIMRLAIKLPV